MSDLSLFQLRGGGRLAYAAVVAAGAWLAAYAGPCFADPQVYTADVVTDVTLGKTSYHNAEVVFTFVGDTDDISVVTDPSTGQPIQSHNCRSSPVFYWLPKGQATVSISSQGKQVVAKFLPGQLFVGLDVCSGGIGIGSLPPGGGVEAAYPLGFTGGDVRDHLDYCGGPACLTGTMYGSGTAFSCVGYPGQCSNPNSLQTDKGEFLISTPYQDYWAPNWDRFGSLNQGFFSTYPGSSSE